MADLMRDGGGGDLGVKQHLWCYRVMFTVFKATAIESQCRKQ
jgi:hypothetical protein